MEGGKGMGKKALKKAMPPKDEATRLREGDEQAAVAGLRLGRAGLEVPLTEQAEGTPGRVLSPAAEIMGQFEIDLGLITPTIQYAMIDNALRAHEGQTMEDHRSTNSNAHSLDSLDFT